MKPAVCFLCGELAVDEPLNNKGDWVEFADYQLDTSTTLNHPDGLEYVCKVHIAAVKQLVTKTSSDALLELRRQYGKFNENTYHKPNSNIQKLWGRLSSILKR